MYDNIGEKIKGLATAITVLGIIVSIISGLLLFSLNQKAGLVTILIGCIISYVSNLCLYGFGELIVKVTVIANQNVNNKQNIKQKINIKKELLNFLKTNYADLRTPENAFRYVFNICEKGDREFYDIVYSNHENDNLLEHISQNRANLLELKGIQSIDTKINGNKATLFIVYGDKDTETIVLTKLNGIWIGGLFDDFDIFFNDENWEW
jgi:hypothetical protein